EQPNCADTQFLEIIELLDQPTKIADTIRVAVVKCPHVQLVDDRVLIPKRIRHCLELRRDAVSDATPSYLAAHGEQFWGGRSRPCCLLPSEGERSPTGNVLTANNASGQIADQL